MISQTTIQAIRDLHLPDAIGRYVELKKKGTTWTGLSPFHDEKTPSFFVHPVKGFWKDFSSGKGGRDVISFLMEKESLDFVGAIRMAAQDFSIPIEEDRNGSAEYYAALEKKKQIMPVLEWAWSEFQRHEVPKYFLDRFSSETCTRFGIGFCTGIIGEAKKAGIEVDLLHQSGLINFNEERKEYFEKFAQRVIIPVTDYRGTLIGFTGRKTTDDKKSPKYLHSAFEKSKTLFAIQQALKAIQTEEKAYVVEGPTDAMRFHEKGILNTVGKQGSDFSEEQAKLIKRYCSTVCFVPDNDDDKEKNAGLESLDRNAETAIKAGLIVKVLIPGIGVKKVRSKK